MTRILITGNTGHAGYELERSLQSLGEIIAVDRKQNGIEPRYVAAPYQFECRQCNICKKLNKLTGRLNILNSFFHINILFATSH
ncbi:hypothetical protein [Janthinobacterium sp. PC23-8]|uniref:hypothetical protein n=1 Tax=Janthinobacterium sp. PC23-8 TaxID=2012679 RepID=UPI000B974B18|nr:hypothetical protein [Janthinobacterium sp. PC23-8]OYO31117.1 hypothetical protein CD932_08275 [Janthinobacterium sp. PC23-8]